jgi:hypothetical protein
LNCGIFCGVSDVDKNPWVVKRPLNAFDQLLGQKAIFLRAIPTSACFWRESVCGESMKQIVWKYLYAQQHRTLEEYCNPLKSVTHWLLVRGETNIMKHNLRVYSTSKTWLTWKSYSRRAIEKLYCLCAQWNQDVHDTKINWCSILSVIIVCLAKTSKQNQITQKCTLTMSINLIMLISCK